MPHNVFPKTLSKAIHAINSEKRQLILSYLIYNYIATKDEIKKTLNLDDEDLDKQIKILEESHIIRPCSDLIKPQAIGDQEAYMLTDFGIMLLNNIFKALIPGGEDKDA